MWLFENNFTILSEAIRLLITDEVGEELQTSSVSEWTQIMPLPSRSLTLEVRKAVYLIFEYPIKKYFSE